MDPQQQIKELLKDDNPYEEKWFEDLFVDLDDNNGICRYCGESCGGTCDVEPDTI